MESTQSSASQPEAARESKAKKTRTIVLFATVVIATTIVLIALCMNASGKTSPEKVVNDFFIALKRGNLERLDGKVPWDGTMVWIRTGDPNLAKLARANLKGWNMEIVNRGGLAAGGYVHVRQRYKSDSRGHLVPDKKAHLIENVVRSRMNSLNNHVDSFDNKNTWFGPHIKEDTVAEDEYSCEYAAEIWVRLVDPEGKHRRLAGSFLVARKDKSSPWFIGDVPDGLLERAFAGAFRP